LINLENHGSVCAVDIRKSTEDGLEQDSNSRDAQREAGGPSCSTVRASLVSTSYEICANVVPKKFAKKVKDRHSNSVTRQNRFRQRS
jgi:hypothetical protein